MQTPRTDDTRLRTQSGFTLLELLISLGLLVLLTSSIAASLFLFMRTETSGRSRVERAQIVRAVYFRMTNDLRCVTYREEIKVAEDAEGVSAAEDDSQEEEDDNTVLEVTAPDDAYGNRTDGLYGNSSTLVIYTSRPPRTPPKLSISEESSGEDSLLTLGSEGYYSGSGYRAVSWFLAGESSSGLAGSVTPAQGSDAETSSATGLARMDGDALELMFSANEMGFEDASSSGQTQVLAPEVTSLSFRYFDGFEWTDSWDSRAMERLPNAVEVTLELSATGENEADQTLLLDPESDDAEARTVRFVISLQVAPPPLTEVQL
ncbi:MAG TPA: type II secretion system protein GspJ [Planctomycetaceae bacterium]|nr:type II secretion system protein GspJ [Planctomycetaceae bacterium]